MVTEAPSRTRPGLRTAGLVLAAAVRMAGIVLLGTSVVLGWRASYARFGVCFGADVPPVDLPADQPEWWCAYMQDHQYDQYMPSDPWVPIPDAARLEGLSLMALGAGVAVVALSLVGRWFVWLLSVVAGAGLGAAWVGMGVPVWRTALAGGERVGYESWVAASGWTALTVLATAGLAALCWVHGGRDGKVAAVFWAALTLAQPFPEFILSLFLWGSHDTSPLVGVFRCAMVAFAGLVAAVTFLPAAWRERFLYRPLRATGRVVSRARATTADTLGRADTWRDPRVER